MPVHVTNAKQKLPKAFATNRGVLRHNDDIVQGRNARMR